MELNDSDKKSTPSFIEGVGLGLRRSLMTEMLEQQPEQISFFEVAPENWINVGGRYGRQFREITESRPLICHGLSLSIGGPTELDFNLLKQLKRFISDNNVSLFSEHLSYCSDHAHLYDLMPLPFTEEAVNYVSGRISKVQDFLGQQIAMENISYYAAPGQHMAEIDFITAILEKSDCKLLLDINNIYVNSINHGYDAENFMFELPKNRIEYFHMAGHYVEAEDLRIDTHGAPICDPVYELLDKAYKHFGSIPTLLERDFNIPPLSELLTEVNRIIEIQSKPQKIKEQQIV